MKHPRVSIIIPNFNKGKFVVDCLQSVKNQTIEDWQVLFVDDGSTDGSDAIAQKLSREDERIEYYTNPRKGASAARNYGLEKAKGKFVLFLDSDDLIAKTCLEERLKDVESTDLDFTVYPTGVFFHEVGDSNFICNVPNKEKDLHRFLNRDIVWLISGPIWRKETLDSLGGFDESLQSQQDYDLHVRALITGKKYKYFHRKPDVFYRQVVDSLPRRNSQTIEHFQFRYEMVLRHHTLLRENDKLGEDEKILLARYLLDLGQMMRWHIEAMGKKALKRGLKYWSSALELGLVSKSDYKLGKRYIKFKHNMKWNRLPYAQNKREQYFRTRLGDLIFYPSGTFCKMTMEDYAA